MPKKSVSTTVAKMLDAANTEKTNVLSMKSFMACWTEGFGGMEGVIKELMNEYHKSPAGGNNRTKLLTTYAGLVGKFCNESMEEFGDIEELEQKIKEFESGIVG